MAIETDLSVSPYFDEGQYDISKNYYKVLFKPSVPVQVRELNELQTLLQNQIEEFGDNILKRGTIIRGCSFTFYNNYPYIKINDNYIDGTPVNPSALVGKFLTSTAGHTAVVLDYADGFEQSSPDTKTLYIKYINSGSSGSASAFAVTNQLTVTDSVSGIAKVNISNPGTGYSNSDAVVFLSQIAVTDNTGPITVGQGLIQPSSGAKANVVAIDSTTYTDKIIVQLKPVNADFTDSTKTATAWTFLTGPDSDLQDVTNSSVVMSLTEIIGTDAAAIITTDSVGKITDASITNVGAGYYYPPYVAVRNFAGGVGGVLTSQNYYNKLTVFNDAAAVGNAYAFGISPGVVYQKGYFLNVEAQTKVVGKYTQFPNNVSVGFRTWEDIVDAYEDTNLLDNAQGTRNYTAPGADRLKLYPELVVIDTDAARANTDFLPIVEFSDGVPYKQNQRTQYNVIADTMAQRTYESTGDYVIDPFLVACRSTTNSSMVANTFTVVVDPGKAYIDGYRVETFGSYDLTLDKGIDRESVNNIVLSVDYGSYVVVKEMAGTFQYSTGATVWLYDAAKQYLSNNSTMASGTITAAGNKIGQARIRSIKSVDTDPLGTAGGSANSKYNMYLFDVQMTLGKSFKDVRSIAYTPDNGSTFTGIADVVTVVTTGTGSNSTVNSAVLAATATSEGYTLDRLLFKTGYDSPLAINTISYTYRTFSDDGTYKISNAGAIAITLTDKNYFPYNGDLTPVQKSDLLFFPLTTMYVNSAITGTVWVSNSSTYSTNSSYVFLKANSATAFLTDLQVGDYVSVANSTPGSNAARRVMAVYDDSTIMVDTAFPTPTNYTSATVTRMFPKYVPFPILTRNGVTATVAVNSTSRTLTIDLGKRLSFSGTSNVAAGFNIQVIDATPDTKIPVRNLYTKICIANNVSGFGLDGYGDEVTGTFTNSSNTVTITNANTYFNVDDYISIYTSGYAGYTNPVSTVKQVYSVNSTAVVMTTAANFTGSAQVRRAINLNGPWCLGVPDVFRLKAVYLANSSSVNSSSFDVTREFYVDHNQTPSYYGLSYLVRDRNSKLVLNNDDWLLVQYDAFKGQEGAVVHINSYVDSNAGNRYSTDSMNLATLDTYTNSSLYVNTLEIPEVHSATGEDFDLISYFDFRPRAVNTAILTQDYTAANVNPSAAITFSSADKRFPAPQSIGYFNVEYFKGRVDTVYVDSSGKIGVSRGYPAANSDLVSTNKARSLAAPVKNKKTMILNNIVIPAYPCIEENKGTQLAEILAKSVINERVLDRRLRTKKVTRLFTATDVSVKQPIGYNMEAIGNLERRIRDLEYYVSLTNLEVQIRDLNLPSSLVGNINRAKYGFFADTYDTEKMSDVTSLEYKAKVEGGRVIPLYEIIKHVDPPPAVSYTDFGVINQPNATGNNLPVCVNTAVLEVKEPRNRASSNAYVTMASSLGNSSGLVSVYCYFYGGADEIYVYQSNVANSFTSSPILTANAAAPMSNADVAYVSKLPWFSGISNNSLKLNTVQQNPSRLRYGGKITWNHNPANGRYYKIFVKNDSVVWRYRIEYPINVDCGLPPPPPPVTPNYHGHLRVHRRGDKRTELEILASKNLSGRSEYEVEYHVYEMKAFGLRPFTLHKVKVGGKDFTPLCDTTLESKFPPLTAEKLTAWNNYTGNPFNNPGPTYIMSDASGQITFNLYLIEEIEIEAKNEKDEDLGKEVRSKVLFEVVSDDGNSYAWSKRKVKIETFVSYKPLTI